MKKLHVYEDIDGYVLKRTNELGQATKKIFATEERLLVGLDTISDIEDYQLEVDKKLWFVVINHLAK